MAVATPFAEFSTTVSDAALDYNGHLNDAAYAQVLTDANEVFLDWLGLSAAYRERTRCAMYTVEMTIRFLHEVRRGEMLRASSVVAGHDSKRLTVHTTLKNAADVDVATGRTTYLHVDTEAGRVCSFPADRSLVLDDVAAAHADHVADAEAR